MGRNAHTHFPLHTGLSLLNFGGKDRKVDLLPSTTTRTHTHAPGLPCLQASFLTYSLYSFFPTYSPSSSFFSQGGGGGSGMEGSLMSFGVGREACLPVFSVSSFLPYHYHTHSPCWRLGTGLSWAPTWVVGRHSLPTAAHCSYVSSPVIPMPTLCIGLHVFLTRFPSFSVCPSPSSFLQLLPYPSTPAFTLKNGEAVLKTLSARFAFTCTAAGRELLSYYRALPGMACAPAWQQHRTAVFTHLKKKETEALPSTTPLPTATHTFGYPHENCYRAARFLHLPRLRRRAGRRRKLSA